MPGIVVFNRRWAVGSDDLVVPGIFLSMLHTIWLVILAVVVADSDFRSDPDVPCVDGLYEHLVGYMILFGGCILIEASIAWVSLRGTILYTEPRDSMPYLLYVRLGILFVEMAWLVVGVLWLTNHYSMCPVGSAKDVTVGIVICNFCVILSVVITIWCTFDAAGRSWVKMKNYQRSLRDSRTKFNYKRSGSLHRDWRHRKVVRAYQESWDTRCRLLFCCVGKNDQHQNSFTEIAKLLSEFFRDLDVVPSDVVAGLVLLRKQQKMEKKAIVAQKENETYEFLSGIPITPSSRFLALNDPDILDEFKNVIHYMRYALAVYGWPMYIKGHAGTGICRLCPYLRCCCCLTCCRHRPKKSPKAAAAVIVEDNCCQCNHAAMCQMLDLESDALVYVTYHVEVGETPFFVAMDHRKRKVVVSIRGTLSLQDVITDLNAEGEQLPIDPLKEEWIGHKGMVQAAEYIRRKLKDEMVLSRAFGYDTERGTQTYDMVLVGHSLGAGTAAILAILLRQEFPNLLCYAYSPPGGLLSMPAVEYTKSFITSVVVGKDVVPRIGLHQMESLRSDLINAIKGSKDPKWKVIAGSIVCCSGGDVGGDPLDYNITDKHTTRDEASHPSDTNIALTVHQPLYPPGRIIHVVRHHPSKADQKYEKKWRQVLHKPDPVYQALWADNTDFDQVLISPVMIQDHMPDKVLAALEKVLSNVGPAKPQRIFTDHSVPGQGQDRRQLLLLPEESPSPDSPALDRTTPPHRLCLETSFTDLMPEHLATTAASNQSSGESSTDAAPASLCWEYSITMDDHVSIGPARSLLHHYRGHYDDWGVGLAPLATPETLSEVSSVSSRGSSRFGSARRPLGRFSSSSVRTETTSVDGGDRKKMAASEADFYTETSRLLPEEEPKCPRTVEAVVEMEPARRQPPGGGHHHLDDLELDNDEGAAVCRGARLSFDLSQEDNTRTSEDDDTGYHGGEPEVFASSSPRLPRTLRCNGKWESVATGRHHHPATLLHLRQVLEVSQQPLPAAAASRQSRLNSCHSGADTISDVFDHSLSSNLVSPASVAGSVQQQPEEEEEDTSRPPLHVWMVRDAFRQDGGGGGSACTSPRKWGCGRQVIPQEIIPQSGVACEPPHMFLQHDDVSPDESSV